MKFVDREEFIVEVDSILSKFKLYSHDTNLTYIDIIKGFIPLELYEIINRKLSKKDTIEVLANFRNHLFDKIMTNLWKPRVEYLREIEKEWDITKNKKLENKNKKQYINIHRKIDNRNIENNLDSIKHLIYFGRDILDYYSCHPH